MWAVVYLPEAERERDKLPSGERHALYNAVAKLQAIGPTLGYPHTSAVQGAFSCGNYVPEPGGARGVACTGRSGACL